MSSNDEHQVLTVSGTTQPVSLERKYAGLALEELGPAISRLHRGALDMSTLIRQTATSALEFALEAGTALNAAKEKVPHGEWGAWLLREVPGLSSDRATRYMRMAKEIPHVRNLDQIKTVRQALIATGVIKEPGKNGCKKEGDGPIHALAPADFVSRFRSLRIFLESTRPRLLAGEMPREEVVEMTREVGLILNLFRDIEQHLGKPLALPPPAGGAVEAKGEIPETFIRTTP